MLELSEWMLGKRTDTLLNLQHIGHKRKLLGMLLEVKVQQEESPLKSRLNTSLRLRIDSLSVKAQVPCSHTSATLPCNSLSILDLKKRTTKGL